MKLPAISSVPSMLKKMSNNELLLMVVFVLYIVLPIPTHSGLLGFVNSTIGLVSIFALTVVLFVKGSPILGVLFIFVAYELLRRSSIVHPATINEHELTSYIPTGEPVTVVSQSEKDAQMSAMNPVETKSLEEEMVEIRAPIGGAFTVSFTDSSYKPVAGTLQGASLV